MAYGELDFSQYWYQAITWTKVDLASQVLFDIHLREISEEALTNVTSNVRFHFHKIITTFPRN